MQSTASPRDQSGGKTILDSEYLPSILCFTNLIETEAQGSALVKSDYFVKNLLKSFER